MRFPSDDVEARLEQHAHDWLSPSQAARRRMRSHVERAVREHMEKSGRATTAEPAPNRLPAASARGRKEAPRRLPALLAATLAVVLGAGASLAADPGGPLYPARLWAETLPIPADGDDRARTGIERLENRLVEVARAASRRDGDAASAALDAYRGILEEAVDTAGDDTERLEHLEVALARHLAVLGELADRVPAPARPALDRAIEKSDRAVGQIRAGDRPSGGTRGGGGAP
jgi:hypothetical protein